MFIPLDGNDGSIVAVDDGYHGSSKDHYILLVERRDKRRHHVYCNVNDLVAVKDALNLILSVS